MNLSGKQTIIVNSEDQGVGKRLDVYLSKYFTDNYQELNLTRSFLSKYIPVGVYIDGVNGKNGRKLEAGDQIVVDLDVLSGILSDKKVDNLDIIASSQGSFDIVSETKDWLIINKKAGIAVHPSKGNLENTLVNQVKYYLSNKGEYDESIERGGIVHRLDKPVSGLIIFAKTAKFQKYLMNEFANKAVVKRYSAVVEELVGKHLLIEAGETKLLEGYISRDKSRRFRRVFELQGEGKYASSKITRQNGDKLDIEIYTGRTHQIRATLRYLGLCVKGDVLYGSETEYADKHIDLQCSYLEFKDMEGEVHSFSV